MSDQSRKRRTSRGSSTGTTGRLRIGDNWNAITIIALSQNNPLKAIAEFVENSIDARATEVTVIRGKERGEQYLKITDNGQGIPRGPDEAPDFKYVATHICDSLKRRLKEEGIQGLQGEFGIGLLSFWTVGERMVLSSAGADGKTYQMEMRKNEPGYTISVRKALFSHPGTELLIRPLLPGLRQVSGEKIQSYLAAELRDRMRKSGVKIMVLDRASKKELEVQPRQFTGRLLHEFGTLAVAFGDIEVEVYLNAPGPDNQVGLYKAGTRVVSSLPEMDAFNLPPWSSGYLQGMIDAPFIQLTPGTRTGVVHDERFDMLVQALEGISGRLNQIIELEKAAEDEQTSRNILKSVQKAFKEAFLSLPPEDYRWFDLYSGSRKTDLQKGRAGAEGASGGAAEGEPGVPAGGDESGEGDVKEREFFHYPGPLYSAVISPASAVVKVDSARGLRCIPRDKSRRMIEENVSITWAIKKGGGSLSAQSGEVVTFTAPNEPGLTVIEAEASQGDVLAAAQSMITVSQSLMERAPGETDGKGKGLPGYTFLRAPGELWRSRYDEKNNLIVINNGHRDYLFAGQKHARKLKYICRLYAKELVLINFPGFDTREILERAIELSLYAEEHLK